MNYQATTCYWKETKEKFSALILSGRVQNMFLDIEKGGD